MYWGGLQILLYPFSFKSVHKQLFIFEKVLCISPKPLFNTFESYPFFVYSAQITPNQNAFLTNCTIFFDKITPSLRRIMPQILLDQYVLSQANVLHKDVMLLYAPLKFFLHPHNTHPQCALPLCQL